MSTKTTTDASLIETVYSATHHAASNASAAWTAGVFTMAQATETLRLLQQANAAMMSLHCRLRGVPPPKIGD